MPIQRVVVAAAGTGGHTYPGLAVAEVLLDRGVDCLFVGTDVGIEQRIVPAAGHKIELLPARPFIGAKFRPSFLRANGRAVAQAIPILRRHRIEAVIGFGGFGGFAPVVAGKILGLVTVVHEANETLGLANRALVPIVDRVLWGSSQTVHTVGRYVGIPVRRSIREIRDREPVDGKRPAHLFVTGGSQGAPFLDERAPAAIAAYVAKYGPVEVRHQACWQPERVEARYRHFGIESRIEPFLEHIGEAYEWADIVITRAGASTLAELEACGRPALVVPIPLHARDHQSENAAAFASRGLGLTLSESEWSPEKCAQALKSLLALPLQRAKTRPAAAVVVDQLLEAARLRQAPGRANRNKNMRSDMLRRWVHD